jgi:hypothetical protein
MGSGETMSNDDAADTAAGYQASRVPRVARQTEEAPASMDPSLGSPAEHAGGEETADARFEIVLG